MHPEELSELDLEQVSAGKINVGGRGGGFYPYPYMGGGGVIIRGGGWGWGRPGWGGGWGGGAFIARGPRGGVIAGRGFRRW